MDGFLLLLLEAGVALALLLFIVWWTWVSDVGVPSGVCSIPAAM